MSRGIESAHKRLTDRVISRTGVTGTAIGLSEGEPCIKVYVARKDGDAAARIPRTFQGFPVVVEETGTIRRLED